MSKQKRWPGYYINTKLKQAFHRTPDRKNTTKREHLMVKNVISTHQKEVHWRHSQRRSHITMLFRRITPFWNIEMPHKRDQTKLLTTPQQEVKRCGTSTTKKNEKSQKVYVQTSMKNYKPVVKNSTSTLQPKRKQQMCITSLNPTTRVAKDQKHINKITSTLQQRRKITNRVDEVKQISKEENFNNGGKSRITLKKTKNRRTKKIISQVCTKIPRSVSTHFKLWRNLNISNCRGDLQQIFISFNTSTAIVIKIQIFNIFLNLANFYGKT